MNGLSIDFIFNANKYTENSLGGGRKKERLSRIEKIVFLFIYLC